VVLDVAALAGGLLGPSVQPGLRLDARAQHVVALETERAVDSPTRRVTPTARTRAFEPGVWLAQLARRDLRGSDAAERGETSHEPEDSEPAPCSPQRQGTRT
jgi:hypothetical protein